MAEDYTQINCGDVLDIASVAAFREQCLEALDTKRKIVLKASELERVDTAALQVMAALFQDAKVQQQTVECQAPSDVLCQSAALLGLTDLLQLKHSGD